MQNKIKNQKKIVVFTILITTVITFSSFGNNLSANLGNSNTQMQNNNNVLNNKENNNDNSLVEPLIQSFGRDSLTCYSTASDGGTTKGGNNYNTVWTATSGVVFNTQKLIVIGDYGVIMQNIYDIYRGYVFFDTSSIPDDATINSATLSLYGYFDNSTSDFSITIQNGQPTYPHDPLQTGDYFKDDYSGNGGSLSTSSFTTSGYNDITLNSNGLSWINRQGTTKLILRSSYDINGNAPLLERTVSVYSSEKGGNYRPKLTVNYVTPVAPTVTTNDASNDTSTTATLNGNLNSMGGATSCQVWFQYGLTTSYTSQTTPQNQSSAGVFSKGISGLTAGTMYHFRADASNSGGPGYGGDKSFYTLPGNPSNLYAYSTSQSSISLSWTKGTGGDKTRIQRKTGGYPSSYTDGTQVYFSTGASTTDNGLNSGTTYYYRAWAYDSDSQYYSSGYSQAYATTQSPPPPPPGDPSNLGATATSPNQIHLTWTKGSSSDYTRIQRKTGGYPTSYSDGTMVYFDSGTSADDTGLTSKTTFYYRAWAYSNSGGYSNGYSQASATTPNAPPTAEANGPYQGKVGHVILFHATGSHDSDGYIHWYKWDFNNDGSWEKTSLVSSVPYIYSSSYSGQITLEVIDNNGATATDAALVTISNNNPPNQPTNPHPINGQTNVNRNDDLSWSDSDPDTGDTLIYNIYLYKSGESAPTTPNASGITIGSYDPGRMKSQTTYNWYVVAQDNYGAQTTSPTWQFTTKYENSPPDTPQKPNGDTQCQTGISYTYTASTTDPENNQIYYKWSWTPSPTTYLVNGQHTESTDWSTQNTFTHTWPTATGVQGWIQTSYFLNVQACDDPNGDGNLNDGLGSGWSDNLEIRASIYGPTNPRPKANIFYCSEWAVKNAFGIRLIGNATYENGDPIPPSEITKCRWTIQRTPLNPTDPDFHVLYDGSYQEYATANGYFDYTAQSPDLNPNPSLFVQYETYKITFEITTGDSYYDTIPAYRDIKVGAQVWACDPSQYNAATSDSHSIGLVHAYADAYGPTGAYGVGVDGWIGGDYAYAEHSATINLPDVGDLHGGKFLIFAVTAGISGSYGIELLPCNTAQVTTTNIYATKDDGSYEVGTHNDINKEIGETLFKSLASDLISRALGVWWGGTLTEAVYKICDKSIQASELQQFLSEMNPSYIKLARIDAMVSYLNEGKYTVHVKIDAGGFDGIAGGGCAYSIGQVLGIGIMVLSTAQVFARQGIWGHEYNYGSGLNWQVHSPVSLVIVDPEGRVIDKNNSDIPYASYDSVHTDSNGTHEDTVHLPIGLNGTYQVFVVPDENTTINDTFSLSVTDSFGNITYLAENMSIGNITDVPFYLNISNPNIPLLKLNYPDCDRTINGTLPIQWLAYDNEDEYNLPISIYYSADQGLNWTLIAENCNNSGSYNWDTTQVPNGVYVLQLITNDSDGNRRFALSDTFTIQNFEESMYNLQPNTPSDPNGQIIGRTNITYTFLSNATDPNNDTLFYLFDWGDGNQSGWIGPYISGEYCNASHVWNKSGFYQIKVQTEDKYGNMSNVSGPLNITIDGIAPSIVDTTQANANTGSVFNFNSTVTDNIQVSSVWVEYWYDNETHVNVSMEQITENCWTKTIIIDNTLEALHYFINVNDTADNWNATIIKNVPIADNIEPVISNVGANPSFQIGGQFVNISATVTDNVGINRVFLSIQYPDTTSQNISITQNKTGNIFYCNQTYEQGLQYLFHLWTDDTSGNSKLTPTYTFIIDNPPNEPTAPTPPNNSSTTDIILNLSWNGGDPDFDDMVTYDIYFGSTNPPQKVESNQSALYYDPGILEYGTTYYWKIVSWDSYHISSTQSLIWHFTTNYRPNQPSNPQPLDGAMIVDINDNLSWIGGDPDSGDIVTYDVYFGMTNPPLKIISNQSSTTYSPETMEYGTTYYWMIVPWDNHQVTSDQTSIWLFTTDYSPYEPTAVSPLNESLNISITSDLNWTGGDPDIGDAVTYDVYFGNTSPPQLVSHNQSNTTYDPGTMQNLTTYYWMIVSWDSQHASMQGSLWWFTTKPQDRPPYAPFQPSPPDGVTGVPVNVNLSWSGGDPDNDPVTYDIYFDTTNPPVTKISSNQSNPMYPLNGLTENTTYYWRIVAWDTYPMSTTSPIWSFITNKAPVIAPPEYLNPSWWRPGYKYCCNVTASDPDNDEVSIMIDWGDGNYSAWAPWNPSGSEVMLTHTWTAQNVYSVKAKSRDMKGAESNWSEIVRVNVCEITNFSRSFIAGDLTDERNLGDWTYYRITWIIDLSLPGLLRVLSYPEEIVVRSDHHGIVIPHGTDVLVLGFFKSVIVSDLLPKELSHKSLQSKGLPQHPQQKSINISNP